VGGFVLSLLLFLVILFFLPMRYAVNDDLVIAGILSGKDGFASDSFVYFLSPTMSSFLNLLYKHFPSVPWYGLTIVFVSYMGVSLIAGVIMRCGIRDRVPVIFSVPAFVSFAAYCVLYSTFTTSSLLMEFGVLLSLLEWQVRGKAPVKNTGFYCLFLAVCFLLALALRWEIVLYSLVFGFPSLLFIKKEHLKGFSLIIAVIVLSVTIDRTIFFRSTTTPEIANYIVFNKLRAEFHDTAKGDDHGDITYKAASKVGWTYDDYQFFKIWNVYDETLFNADTLNAFLEENHPLQRGSQYNWERFRVEFSVNGKYPYIFIFTLLSLLAWRFHSLIKLSEQGQMKVFISFCLLLAISVFLMMIRYRMHVFAPLFAYLICIFLLLSHLNESSAHKKEGLPLLKRFTAIIAALLFFSAVGACYFTGKQEFRYFTNLLPAKNYIQTCLQIVKRHYPPYNFMVLMSPDMPSSLGFEKVHPLREFSDLPEVRIFPAVWQVNSPRYFSILREMHLKGGHDFLARAVVSQDILFVLFVRSGEQHRATKYLWESYVNRRVMPDAHLSLTPVYDLRVNEHYGLIFYRWSGTY
jgi:hypothetical protein